MSGGEFIYEAPEHTCGMSTRYGTTGSIWRCGCGRLWKRYDYGWLRITRFALWSVKLRQRLRGR